MFGKMAHDQVINKTQGLKGESKLIYVCSYIQALYTAIIIMMPYLPQNLPKYIEDAINPAYGLMDAIKTNMQMSV